MPAQPAHLQGARRRTRGRVACSTLLLAATLGCAAQPPSNARPVIPLANGLNTLSLTAAPLPAQAFLAHRDNGNAHGFDVLTLYILAPSSEGVTPEWQLVPAFDARDGQRRHTPGGEHLTLTTFDGADCRLRDVRLLAATATADAVLIVADRDLGDSFASPAPVTFRYFTLRHNVDDGPGWPVYYFAFDHERRAMQPYCDVGEAFRAELGVGPSAPVTR